MEQYLTIQQLDILYKVAQEARKPCKKALPLVMEVGNEAATSVIGFLPYFLGKGTLKGDKQNICSPNPSKPILVLATSAVSLVKLKMTFGKESFLIKGGVMECKENGLPYTTHVVPTVSAREPDEHDLILGGTYHYQWFPKDYFLAVIAFESNSLCSEILRNIILYFKETKTVLVEINMGVNRHNCRLNSNDSRLSNIPLNTPKNNAKMVKILFPSKEYTDNKVECIVEDEVVASSTDKATSKTTFNNHPLFSYRTPSPKLHEVIEIESNDQPTFPSVKVVQTKKEANRSNGSGAGNTYDKPSQVMQEYTQTKSVEKDGVQSEMKSSENDSVQPSNYSPIISVEQFPAKNIQSNQPSTRNHPSRLPASVQLSFRSSPTIPAMTCSVQPTLNPYFPQPDIRPLGPAFQPVFPVPPVDQYFQKLTHPEVNSPANFDQPSKTINSCLEQQTYKSRLKSSVAPQVYQPMYPTHPSVLPSIYPYYQQPVYQPNVLTPDHSLHHHVQPSVQHPTSPYDPQVSYSTVQTLQSPTVNKSSLYNHPVQSSVQPFMSLHHQEPSYPTSRHFSHPRWSNSPNKMYQYQPTAEQSCLYPWCPSSYPMLQPDIHAWIDPFCHSPIHPVQPSDHTMFSNFQQSAYPVDVDLTDQPNIYSSTPSLQPFQPLQQPTINPCCQHHCNFKPIAKIPNNQPILSQNYLAQSPFQPLMRMEQDFVQSQDYHIQPTFNPYCHP